MPTPSDYIANAKAQGATDDAIKSSLKTAGWTDAQIAEAFTAHVLGAPPPPPSNGMTTQTTAKPSSAWDAFEHVLLFISLYVLYTSLALTLHFFIDKYVTSPSSDEGYGAIVRNTYGLMLFRGYLAAMIVSSPLFSFFHLKVTKRTIAHPEIRNLGARKSLIYLTLVITFVVALVNIISIIYNLLNGNVTLNFVLHFAVTIALSALIFIYYLTQITADRKSYV